MKAFKSFSISPGPLLLLALLQLIGVSACGPSAGGPDLPVVELPAPGGHDDLLAVVHVIVLPRPGGHHFDRNYALIENAILDRVFEPSAGTGTVSPPAGPGLAPGDRARQGNAD